MRIIKYGLGLCFVLGVMLLFSVQQVLSSPPQFAPLQATVTPRPQFSWNISTKLTQESSQKPPYTITIRQPVLQSADGNSSLSDNFTAAVEKMKAAAIADFKNSASQAVSVPDTSSFLDISYDLYITRGGLVSVRFTLGSYIAGAAHPLTASDTINYDPNTRKVMALADLFKPGAKYLDIISKIATADLKQQGRLSLPDGATAKAENYVNWNLDRGGLLITFDPYQVGAYAEGPSEVLIPYTSLGDALKVDIFDLS